MRAPILFATAAMCAGMLLTACVWSSSNSSPTEPSRVEFTVMTFNIQHGLDGAGRYGLQAAIDTIARIRPDLVGVQELTRNHPAYNCEDGDGPETEGLGFFAPDALPSPSFTPLHNSSRIDYIFYVPGNALELRSIENADTRTLIGREASDHNPLVATFAIK